MATDLYVFAKQPWLHPATEQWLSFYQIDRTVMYLSILELFTPDGDEEEFFFMFDQAFNRSGLLSGSLEYIDQQIMANQLYTHIYEQVMHSSYFELLIRSEINNLYLINDRDMVLGLGMDPE